MIPNLQWALNATGQSEYYPSPLIHPPSLSVDLASYVTNKTEKIRREPQGPPAATSLFLLPLWVDWVPGQGQLLP